MVEDIAFLRESLSEEPPQRVDEAVRSAIAAQAVRNAVSARRLTLLRRIRVWTCATAACVALAAGTVALLPDAGDKSAGYEDGEIALEMIGMADCDEFFGLEYTYLQDGE